jgi:hypothetical protein
MKNKLLQTTVGTAIALMMLFAASHIFVSGQEGAMGGVEDRFYSPENPRQAIEGVWQTTVTLRVCQTGDPIRTFRGLTTYHEGGTVSEFSAGSSPVLRSPAHGTWKRVDRATYTGSFIFLRFNADGTFAGTQKTTVTNELSPDENTYDSTAAVQILDVTDNVVAALCATAVGTRFE